VALASYGFGAYIAARLRVPSTDTSEIMEFRNGTDGLLVWALATLLTGLIALVQATLANIFRSLGRDIGRWRKSYRI
jgi:hypothetical protein